MIVRSVVRNASIRSLISASVARSSGASTSVSHARLARSVLFFNKPCPVSSIRHFSATPAMKDDQQAAARAAQSTPIGQIEPKLSITFTCSVTDCGHRSTHEFTKRSYERGIVIVQCPGCKNRHLIADNLSWFTETPSEPKTIEQMIEAKGGKVKRGVQYTDGKGHEDIEIYNDDESTKAT